jgi:hypothetical protein
MIDLTIYIFITVIQLIKANMLLLHDLGRADPSVMVHIGINRFDIQLPAVYAESLGILIGTDLLGIPDNPDLISFGTRTWSLRDNRSYQRNACI